MSVKPVNDDVAPQSMRLQRQEQRRLLKSFQIIIIFLFVVSVLILSPASIESLAAAIFIGCAALLPAYLWCSGRALGMPIFPVFALTYLWTYALPLIGNHPEVVKYSPESQLISGATVAGFLFIGTAVWYGLVRSYPEPAATYRTLEGRPADWFLLLSLAANVFFSMGVMGGWFVLDGGLFSLIRGILLGLLALSVFVLSYRWGRKDLKGKRLWLFLGLLIQYIFTSSASLLLVGSLSVFLLASVGYIVGRGRVAWLRLILLLAALVVLHYGKTAMREKYLWVAGQELRVQPWEYPAFFAEWLDYSLRSIGNPELQSSKGSLTFVERAGLVHLLLLTQEKTPDKTPYLLGSTYAIIPEMLIPRFITPDKAISHEGTTLLNVHYGKQQREDSRRTTIGWGLLSEAYANFGFFGCGGLAILLGGLYGLVARWCMRTPILSARSLFAVLLMSIAFQTEFSAGVYVTALFQSTVPLVVMTFVLMKAQRSNELTSGGTPATAISGLAY